MESNYRNTDCERKDLSNIKNSLEVELIPQGCGRIHFISCIPEDKHPSDMLKFVFLQKAGLGLLN